MKKHALSGLLFAVLFILALNDKAHAAPLDFTRCAAIAATYSENPFSVALGDLDTLRQCISEQMAATVAAREMEKSDRAIVRNFLRDSE